MTSRTPCDDGLFMPAEWTPHDACLISWPCRQETWYGHFEKTKRAYLEVIRRINAFENVIVLADPSTAEEARARIGSQADIIEVPLDDSWIRDNGPIFVRNEGGKVAMVKFGFNGWGSKAPSFRKDDDVPVVLSNLLCMRLYVAPMVLEGGAISVDGEGTLMTTEQCLLNPNRNPHPDRDRIERLLSHYLGIRKVIWLGRGVEGDMTDGHVDGVASFAGPRLVLAAWTNDTTDPNFKALDENLERLQSSTDAKGRSIEVVKLIQPRPREVDGIPITPGYTNHYIANGGVIVPAYGIREDEMALDTLRSVYPDREVVSVDCSYIEIGGGAVHCITQQKPVGTAIPPERGTS
ncbi:MAG: agmatine deiminase family protein [Thermoplasmata archaeon]